MRTFPKELAELRRLVAERTAVLRRLSSKEALAIGRQPAETVDVHGRPAQVSVTVESQSDGTLRVVVQGSMRTRFVPSAYSVAVEGFYMSPTGTIELMSDDELADFD